jgi:hypothetical protein
VVSTQSTTRYSDGVFFFFFFFTSIDLPVLLRCLQSGFFWDFKKGREKELN